MKPSEKNYFECRFYILGDRNVGKKSFIDRILSMPSTSIIRNIKAEKNFNLEINKLLKLNELSDEEYYKQLSDNVINSAKESQELSKKLDDQTNLPKKNKIKNQTNQSPDPLEEQKNRFIMKSLVKYQVLSNRFKRPPLPEYPSKLFNVNKTKIIIKPYYIFPAEEISDYLNPSEETISDPDNVYEPNFKFSMKGIIKDLYYLINNKDTIINIDKLEGYKIYIYNFFIFLYDLGEFESFERMIKYFEKINSKLNITNMGENCVSCIIGNKKENKIVFDKYQEMKFNEFIKTNNNIYIMQISTKPFFNFAKFFYELFFTVLTPYHQILFSENNFVSNFKSIALNNSTFDKGPRDIYDPYKNNPGPKYDLNTLYRYISPKELEEAFHDKNKRFSQKIFENKQGPVFAEIKHVKELIDKKKLKTFGYIPQTGGILNKTPKGFSFGSVKGKLNLIKSRKEIISEINKNIRESLEDDCTLYNMNQSWKSKDQEYFNNVNERKKKFLEEKSNINKERNEKKIEKNKNNLKLLEEKEEEKKNLLLTKLNLLKKSSSTPDLMVYSPKNKTDQHFYKERLINILYPKNRENMKKYIKKRNFIIKNMPPPTTPGPSDYNISNNILDPRKGLSILERHNSVFGFQKADPAYPDLKDDFDIIVERAQKTAGIKKFFRPRFQGIIKEKDAKPYIDINIWKKWENNKKNLKKSGRIKKFLDYRRNKLQIQNDNIINIIKERKQIEDLTREISIKKGYGDPFEIKDINYSLVEDSSPKYSIKGKYLPKAASFEDFGSLFLNESEEVLNAIVSEQMSRPIPDLNTTKQKLPNIIFPKAERFKKIKEYEGSESLFKDGIFSPKEQKNFFNKEPFSNKAHRTRFGYSKDKSPSPAEYRIKGQFEIIEEKGKIVSDIRDSIRNKENDKIDFKEKKKNMDINGEIKDKNDNDSSNVADLKLNLS